MSFEDPTTQFLDELYAWYQAGEPASYDSGDEATAVQNHLASVHKAYHQLDQVLQDELKVQWSHFLQACRIRPRHREWIWQAIEKLTVQLGYDVMYFETGPEPADEPEPDEMEERQANARDVKWAKRLYYTMHKDVHGYRPDGVAAVTKDMDEVQRFLAQLGAIVARLPALRTPGSAPPSGASLPGIEKGISRLFRYHDALPEADKEAIEREWAELTSAICNYTEARLYVRSLHKRMADKLGHAAQPTLPAAQGELSVAGPVLLPDEDSHRWNKSRSRRVGAIGGTLVAVAAVVTFVLLPEPLPVPKKPIAVTEPPTISALPVTSYDYSTCEVPAKSVVSRPVPAISTPKRRKASKYQFLKDTDAVIFKREGKPSVQVTVTEIPDEKTLELSKKAGQRVHTIEMEEFPKPA